jgi:LysM repeat protein
MNNLNKRHTIYVGKRIKVPTKNGGIEVRGEIASAGAHSSNQYRARYGDSGCSIAKRHGMNCNEFLRLNGLSRNSVIRVGQLLDVSIKKPYHYVTKGQTACGIAERYGVSCSRLLRANSLSKRAIIKVGQRLKIP